MYKIGKNLVRLAMKGNCYAIEKIANSTPYDFGVLTYKYHLLGVLHWEEHPYGEGWLLAKKFILRCKLWLEDFEELIERGYTLQKYLEKYGFPLLEEMK